MAKAELDKLGKFEQDILTPEERAALAEDDDENEVAAQKRAGTHVAADADNEEEEEDETDETHGDDDAAATEGEAAKPAVKEPDAKAADEPAKAEIAPPAEAKAPPEPAAFVPQLPKIEIPADAAEKLAARRTDLETRQAALEQKLDDGEIASADYRSQARALQTERDKLVGDELDLHHAERDNKRIDATNESIKKQVWASQCEYFIGQNDQYKSPVMRGALNQAVIEIANTPEGPQKGGFWILGEAHKMVMKEFGQIPPAATKETPPAKQPKGAKEAAKAPMTLAGVPAASDADVSKDKYAAIDALVDKGDWQGYERAIAKLSPDEEREFSDVGRHAA